MVFTEQELCSATLDYSRKSIIGKGGFGTVYRGRVRGSLNVAIKVLNKVSFHSLTPCNIELSIISLVCCRVLLLVRSTSCNALRQQTSDISMVSR